jgi:cyanophycinase
MLSLTGSGEYLPRMEEVDRELIRRLPEPARVVCLPTAAGTEGPQRIGYWSKLGVDHFSRLGAQVEALPVIDRTSANDPGLAAAISKASFVYLSGGKPNYLYDTLAGSRAWEAIRAVLEQGGVLAGCSAGAMIMGEKFYGFPGLKNGFNFLPGATVVPHFDEVSQAWLQPIRLAVGNKLTLLGIDGYTALVQSESNGEVKYDVLGFGGVTIWNGKGKTRYTKGPMPGW